MCTSSKAASRLRYKGNPITTARAQLGTPLVAQGLIDHLAGDRIGAFLSCESPAVIGCMGTGGIGAMRYDGEVMFFFFQEREFACKGDHVYLATDAQAARAIFYTTQKGDGISLSELAGYETLAVMLGTYRMVDFALVERAEYALQRAHSLGELTRLMADREAAGMELIRAQVAEMDLPHQERRLTV